MSFILHKSITHVVSEQLRVCLLNQSSVPKADFFPRSVPSELFCYRPPFTQNIYELLVHVICILTPFSWLSQIFKAPVPIQPVFLAAALTSKPLIFFPPSLNYFYQYIWQKYNEVKGGECCPVLRDAGPHFLQKIKK